MRNKIFMASAIFWCGTALAQLIQLDPQELRADAHPENDARLVAARELPSNDQQEFSQAVKASNAEWLKAHPDVMITLEGNADERGDIIYNLVLSGERAMTVKDALVEMGVSPDRIAFATGWGMLYPICTQNDESCWSQNRRTHFATWPLGDQESRIASR